MPSRAIAADFATNLLGLSRSELETEAGRERLVQGLLATLAHLGVAAPPACGCCCDGRPGLRQAVDGLNAKLADALEHAELLAELTTRLPSG